MVVGQRLNLACKTKIVNEFEFFYPMMNNIFKQHLLLIGIACFMLSACRTSQEKQDQTVVGDSTRIVSINGTVSEILAGLGLEANIVGVDVASTYPSSLLNKPKVGHSRNIAAEGVLALQPDFVIGVSHDVNPELVDQLKTAGIKIWLFDHEFSTMGAKKLIRAVSDSLVMRRQGDSLINRLEEELKVAATIPFEEPKPKVLFIYARGTGTMMVGGAGTPTEEIIRLAGGQNAVTGFADFKPLTSEALVAADPDAILLFSSGMESLGGSLGLLQVQGIKQTKAGKNQHFIAMDGQLLTGFSPRLGQAVKELAEKIH